MAPKYDVTKPIFRGGGRLSLAVYKRLLILHAITPCAKKRSGSTRLNSNPQSRFSTLLSNKTVFIASNTRDTSYKEKEA